MTSVTTIATNVAADGRQRVGMLLHVAPPSTGLAPPLGVIGGKIPSIGAIDVTSGTRGGAKAADIRRYEYVRGDLRRDRGAQRGGGSRPMPRRAAARPLGRGSSRSRSCATGAPTGRQRSRGGLATMSVWSRPRSASKTAASEPRRRRRLGLSAVLRRCGRHAPARLGPAHRRAPGRRRCARGRAGHAASIFAARAWPSAPTTAFGLDLPYVREGMIGVGVYALSDDGRRRFGEFPDVIADDGYVRMLFDANERVRVDDAPVRVYAPERLSDLVRIKTRSRLGRYELGQRFPDLVARERTTKSYRNAHLGRSSCDPGSGRPPRSTRRCPSDTRRRARRQLASIGRLRLGARPSSRRPDRR